jgi:hypothetical protein
VADPGEQGRDEVKGDRQSAQKAAPVFDLFELGRVAFVILDLGMGVWRTMAREPGSIKATSRKMRPGKWTDSHGDS